MVRSNASLKDFRSETFGIRVLRRITSVKGKATSSLHESCVSDVKYLEMGLQIMG